MANWTEYKEEDHAPAQSHTAQGLAEVIGKSGWTAPQSKIDVLSTFSSKLDELNKGMERRRNINIAQRAMYGPEGAGPEDIPSMYMEGMGSEFNDYKQGIRQDILKAKDNYLQTPESAAALSKAHQESAEQQELDSRYSGAESSYLPGKAAHYLGRFSPYVLPTVGAAAIERSVLAKVGGAAFEAQFPVASQILKHSIVPDKVANAFGAVRDKLPRKLQDMLQLNTGDSAKFAVQGEGLRTFLPNYTNDIALNYGLGALNQNTTGADSAEIAALFSPVMRLSNMAMTRMPDSPIPITKDRIALAEKLQAENPRLNFKLGRAERTDDLGAKTKLTALDKSQDGRNYMANRTRDQESSIASMLQETALPDYNYAANSRKYVPRTFDNNWTKAYDESVAADFAIQPNADFAPFKRQGYEDLIADISTSGNESVLRNSSVKKILDSAKADAVKVDSMGQPIDGFMTKEQYISQSSDIDAALKSMKASGQSDTSQYSALKKIRSYYDKEWKAVDPDFKEIRDQANTRYAFGKALKEKYTRADGTLDMHKLGDDRWDHLKYDLGGETRNAFSDGADMARLLDLKGQNFRSSTLADNDAAANAQKGWFETFADSPSAMAANAFSHVVPRGVSNAMFDFMLWDSKMGFSPTSIHNGTTVGGTAFRNGLGNNSSIEKAIEHNARAQEAQKNSDKRSKR